LMTTMTGSALRSSALQAMTKGCVTPTAIWPSQAQDR
jgi:hypothetical protein